MKPNPKIDDYLLNAQKWRQELQALRTILLECPLDEELKWGSPCYAFEGKNVAVIGGLKDCCTLSFFKGALLKDSEGILSKPGENTRAARVIHFVGIEEIGKLQPILKSYLLGAIELEKAGKVVDFAKDAELPYPEELERKLAESPELEAAFQGLTPGRRRAYLMHFTVAKQSKTREARIGNYREKIMSGKGLQDCHCGLFQRMPRCDGSHKNLC